MIPITLLATAVLAFSCAVMAYINERNLKDRGDRSGPSLTFGETSSEQAMRKLIR